MKMKSAVCLLAGLLLAGCASQSPNPVGSASAQLERLGHHSLKVTTRSVAAQRAFDRGLTFAYGFSHHAAEQEFRRALEADPNCAMAWWGIALVNGPHINFPLVPPDKAATAWQALTNAQAQAASVTPFEKALLRALGQRYAETQPEDRSRLDLAYAAAMRQVWQDYPQSADAGTLFAEAIMDLHPWDLWHQDQPQPWTHEILATLERVLELDPKHPGANHLYIHAVEASPRPASALGAANRLRNLVPDVSHLVHMPAHIYARLGLWEQAAQSNRDAIQADARYRAAYPRPGFYNVYMAHNLHFLAFAAMMQGRSEETLQSARRMVAAIPDEFLKELAPVVDGFMIFGSEALMRFGRWEEILAVPEPAPNLPLSRALWRFTRVSALTALHRPEEARAERVAFDQAVAAVPKDWRFGNNAAADLLAIATRVLEGETLAQSGQFDAAIAALRQAAQLEDQLRYDEPPDWIQPVRHTLGAVLLRAGKSAEAEAVYLEDLRRFPENGWSLLGMRDALQAQGKEAEARQAGSRFKQAWRKADIQAASSCFCQAGFVLK